MKVNEVMTPDPVCCTPETRLDEVARMMADADCGAIPVVEGRGNPRIVGIITDRDIVCRAIATAEDPRSASVSEYMTTDVVTVKPDDDLDDAERRMERRKIRRAVVVDERHQPVGIIAQADIALRADEREVAELLRDVSQPEHRKPIYGRERHEVH